MFKEIHSKLKAVAKLVFGLGITVSVIMGVCLIMCADGIKGGMIMAAGAFVSWFASYLFYGLGELIEETKAIRENLDNK